MKYEINLTQFFLDIFNFLIYKRKNKFKKLKFMISWVFWLGVLRNCPNYNFFFFVKITYPSFKWYKVIPVDRTSSSIPTKCGFSESKLTPRPAKNKTKRTFNDVCTLLLLYDGYPFQSLDCEKIYFFSKTNYCINFCNF